MPSPTFTAGDPVSLIIAADARLARTDYTDDQIWELSLSGGEPPALAFETTYGLRAQRLRIFPRFLLNDGQRSDPASFFSPPRVVCSYPNYLLVTYFPFEELEVAAEYWVPESHVAAGRMRLTNHSVLPLTFRFELAALLAPRDFEGNMTPIDLTGGQALAGETGNLQPVLYLSGAPRAAGGPYPALALEYSLYPGNMRMCAWAAAGLHMQQQSLEAAQAAAARSWDAETARVEMLHHSHSLQIETGNPDWDAALHTAQKQAFSLFLDSTLHLPQPSFVLTRRPDQGFSARGDGADHPLPWAGQTALDAYYLASLLPGAPHLAAGLVRNFLAVQDEQGRIDWRPGLGGQRTRRLAQPVLASLAAQAAAALDASAGPGSQLALSEDAPPPGQGAAAAAFYREVYPGLLRFFQAWFAPERDADGDGFPEWENALQTGIDDSPIFDRFAPEPRGTDASRVESPALAAMLYRECAALIDMAALLGPMAAGDLPGLHAARERLAAGLEAAWDERAGLYRYRDYATHLSLPGVSMLSFTGSGTFGTKRRVKRPRRLVIRLDAYEERTYAAELTLRGFTLDGEAVETISPRSFAWLGGQAHAVTQHAYLALEQVDVLGLGERDRGRIFAPDLTQEDCSLLLPLWAGACTPETARQIVETSLPRFRKPCGIALAPGAVDRVSMLWNHLLGEGLLRCGYRAEAGALAASLLSAGAAVLRQQKAFRQLLHAESGQPAGERGHLHGVVPLGLFLQTLGLRQLGANQILLDGFSPFPDPVTVQYRRVKLIFHPDRTEITVGGEPPVTVDRPGLHRLIL